MAKPDPEGGFPLPHSDGGFLPSLHVGCGLMLPQPLADQIRALAPGPGGGGIHIEIRSGTVAGPDLFRRLKPR